MPETEYRDVKWGSILKQRTSDLMSFPEKTFMHTSVLTRKLVFFSALFPPCRKKKRNNLYFSHGNISTLCHWTPTCGNKDHPTENKQNLLIQSWPSQGSQSPSLLLHRDAKAGRGEASSIVGWSFRPPLVGSCRELIRSGASCMIGLGYVWLLPIGLRASQVVLVLKNIPANAGNLRDMGSVLGLGRSPGEGNGNPL